MTDSKGSPKLFLTESEAAHALRVHPSTLGRLSKNGKSPVTPIMVGTRRMYRATDVNNLAGVAA